MEKYMISGIQQVGVGTENFRKTWDWYIQMFGMDIRILEDDTVAERMLPYTGGKAQRRHACIAVNLQGGGGPNPAPLRYRPATSVFSPPRSSAWM